MSTFKTEFRFRDQEEKTMKIGKTLLLVMTAITAMVTVHVQNAPAQAAKKRVAIAPFKMSAPMTDLAAAFGTSQNIGQGVKALMTKELTKSGTMTVVETDLSLLNSEQALANSNRAAQGTGPRLGQIKGADYVLQGDIIIFGRDDQ